MSKVSTLESLLLKIKDQEETESINFLKFYDIQDRSKIGDEHEGIAKKIFDNALPEELNCTNNVQVKFTDGTLSYKIDLVVSNKNEPIRFPNSSNSLVEGRNLLAAFEVKKTLTKELLVEDIKKISKLKEKLINDLTKEDLERVESQSYATELFTNTVVNGLLINERSFNEAELTELQKDLLEQYLVQAYIPFTSCFGFNGKLKRETFIDAFIEGGNGFKLSAWPDIVTCKNMSIVKLDGRPYSSPYYYYGGEKVTDMCIIYAFFESNSFAPYVEHIWEKLNTNLFLGDINTIHSDTSEVFNPILVLAALPHLDNKLVFMSMDSTVDLKYSGKEETFKAVIQLIDLENKKK